jgi:uncharacterized membrane protein YedE/YeeE
MDILIQPDSWLRALIGGAMIGLAAAALMAFRGRVAGISGIFGGLILDRKPGDIAWRALLIAGLLLGPVLAAALSLARPATLPSHWMPVIVAGLLVGFGTRMGNGCTSGHGICGMARFSKRSFAATATFMAFGFLTVFIVRHVL